MIIKADLHVHTTNSDGISTIPQLIEAAKKRGLHAIAVCDHNKCTPLPESDFILIPGTEISTEAGHVLGLFVRDIDFDKLRKKGLPTAQQAAEEIHKRGGICVLAHPFEYVDANEKSFDGVDFDFIETANSRAEQKVKNANELAAKYAKRRGLPETGGSDAHGTDELGGSFTEIECESPAELENALRNGQTKAVFVRRCCLLQKRTKQAIRLIRKHIGKI